MKIVKVFSLVEDKYVYYKVPHKYAAIDHLKKTFDKQYDKIEDKVISGGLPMLWERADNK